MNAIINGKIITENGILYDKVLLFDEKIVDIVDNEEFNKNSVNFIDAMGNYVSAGFIDIHIHGSGGCDTMDGDYEALDVISKTIAKCGVTSFLATTMTMEKEKIYSALDNIRISINNGLSGANLIGAHLEGPFINNKYKGAQNEKYILEPCFEFIKDYVDVIKIITMAPECDKDFRFVEKLSEMKNITLSMGHTNTSYDIAIEAINKGITHATHTFNAMSPFNHREPGAVGAIFNSDITCEVIVDLVHVHPASIDVLLKIKGKDKVVLITDSMRAGCMKKGEYELGGQKVIVDAVSARLEDGTLAGSILTLNKAVYNVINSLGLNLIDAVKMATINPAKVIKIDDKKGSLNKGKDADIIVFNDDIEVLYTFVNGKEVYRA